VSVRALAVACAVACAGLTYGAAGDEKLALVTVVSEQPRGADLRPGDFAVTEDKGTVEVLEAVPARDPLSVVLLVDTALPSDGSAATPEMRRALNAFTATLLAGDPGAQIALYRVANAGIPITDFTSNRAELETGINTIASGTETGSAMLEAVLTAATRLGARPAPRRAIVAVGIGTRDGTTQQPKRVGDAVRQSGATLWVVSVQTATDPAVSNRETVWTESTQDTGGLRQNVVQATRLDGRLQVVANSLLSQYFLKMARSRDGAVKALKGQTKQGAPVLFTRWMR
jgi:hypothetical protein